MTKNDQIYELSILGRATWNLHSLNNEGTVGNVIEPRSVRVIDPNTGEAITTDGISGEMLKHIHAESMWELIKDKAKKLCSACQKLEPARADKNKEINPKNDKVDGAVEKAILCAICDIHGFLVQKPQATRESLVEFGWSVGKGEILRDIHTHARHAPGEKKSTEEEQSSQMVYHRPTRSGTYAVISVLQPWRIGLNNVSMQYVKDIERKERLELVLKAYQAMFLRPEGAMTTTRLPHTEKFEGLIVVSKDNFPAPVISPLKDDYQEQVGKINSNLGNIFDLLKFNDLDEFVQSINGLMSLDPYEVKL